MRPTANLGITPTPNGEVTVEGCGAWVHLTHRSIYGYRVTIELPPSVARRVSTLLKLWCEKPEMHLKD